MCSLDGKCGYIRDGIASENHVAITQARAKDDLEIGFGRDKGIRLRDPVTIERIIVTKLFIII